MKITIESDSVAEIVDALAAMRAVETRTQKRRAQLEEDDAAVAGWEKQLDMRAGVEAVRAELSGTEPAKTEKPDPQPVEPDPQPEPADPQPEEPEVETPEPETETPESEEPEPQDAPPAAPQEAAATLVESLIRKTDKAYKRSKTVTLAEGAVGEEGSEVTDKDGEVCIIQATWRGRAAVEYEDGRAKLFTASDLTLVPQEDVKPPSTSPADPEVQQATETAPTVPANGGNGKAVSLTDLRGAMDSLCEARGRDAGVAVLRQFDAMKMGDVPEEKFPVFLKALQDATPA